MTHVQYAELCNDAYFGPPAGSITVTEYPEKQGFGSVCYLLPDKFLGEDVTIAVMPGSDDALDYLRDIEAWKVAHPWGKVNAGFDRAWKAISEQVYSLAKGRIIWVGHSLGAAMASRGAADQPSRCLECVTFGEPRPGNADYAYRFGLELGSRYTRYVNRNDWVAVMPFLHLGYRHAQQCMWYDGARWQRGVGFWRWLVGMRRLKSSWGDHWIGSYVEAMKDA